MTNTKLVVISSILVFTILMGVGFCSTTYVNTSFTNSDTPDTFTYSGYNASTGNMDWTTYYANMSCLVDYNMTVNQFYTYENAMFKIGYGATDPAQWEYSDTLGTSVAAYGVKWLAQTFTVGTVAANTERTLYAINVSLWRYGSDMGDVTIALRAVSGSYPTGGDLTSGSVDAGTIPAAITNVQFIMDTPYTLEPSTSYAIVLRYPNGDGANGINFYGSTTSVYAGGGSSYSINSGSSWTGYNSRDYSFAEWSYTDGAGFAYYPYGDLEAVMSKEGNMDYYQNVSADWFKGKFNWTEDSEYLSFDGKTLSLNETRLDEQINDTVNMSYVPYYGAWQDVDLGNYDLTATDGTFTNALVVGNDLIVDDEMNVSVNTRIDNDLMVGNSADKIWKAVSPWVTASLLVTDTAPRFMMEEYQDGVNDPRAQLIITNGNLYWVPGNVGNFDWGSPDGGNVFRIDFDNYNMYMGDPNGENNGDYLKLDRGSDELAYYYGSEEKFNVSSVGRVHAADDIEAGGDIIAGGTGSFGGDINTNNNDIENMGTVYHDDTSHWFNRLSSTGEDGGTLYKIGAQWDTGTNYMNYYGWSGISLNIGASTTTVLSSTATAMTITPNTEFENNVTVRDTVIIGNATDYAVMYIDSLGRLIIE